MKENITLQLQTFPCSEIELSMDGMTTYRKELIKVGKYVKDKIEFEVTLDILKHWVKQFGRWIGNGGKIPIPAGHTNDPLRNQGWVKKMWIEDDSSLYGELELSDEKLALTTDVSISVPFETIDGKGNKYEQMIEHVALCVDPVVPGLNSFVTLSLSLGEKNMTFLEKIKNLIKGEEDVELSLPEKEEVKTEDTDNFVKIISENRTLKLSHLVKAQLITPAVCDIITKKYITDESLKIELSRKEDDGSFDFLYKVLENNKPVGLKEVSGPQSLELSNQSQTQPNVLEQDVNRRRKEAGLD